MPDIQRSLFAGYPTTNVATANNPRQDAIDRAFEKADKAFLDKYEAFLITNAAYIDFIAGEITDAYVQRHGAITKSQKKALGGLYQRLMKAGIIEKTDRYRARNQGNPSAVYRLRK